MLSALDRRHELLDAIVEAEDRGAAVDVIAELLGTSRQSAEAVLGLSFELLTKSSRRKIAAELRGSQLAAELHRQRAARGQRRDADAAPLRHRSGPRHLRRAHRGHPHRRGRLGAPARDLDDELSAAKTRLFTEDAAWFVAVEGPQKVGLVFGELVGVRSACGSGSVPSTASGATARRRCASAARRWRPTSRRSRWWSARPGRRRSRGYSRGNRRHRNRGPHRPDRRPQRPLAGGSVTRTRDRARPHHHLRRPTRRHRRGAALSGRRRRGRDPDDRRPGPHRRRHDGGHGGRIQRPRTGFGHRTRTSHRGDPAAVDGTLSGCGLRGRDGRQPQAGAGTRGRHGARTGGHRARDRRRRYADDRGAARPAARVAGDVAGPRWPPTPCSRPSRSAAGIARRRCGCSAYPSPNWPTRCATPRPRSPASTSFEITTCLRRGELEIVTRYEPDGERSYRKLVEFLQAEHTRALYSTDGATVDEQVAALLAGRRVATAESCTAGLVSARLTDRPGSSAYVAAARRSTPTRPRPRCSGSTRA